MGKASDGLARYRAETNARSIDGIPVAVDGGAVEADAAPAGA